MISAIMMVRNEADIVRANVLHHLAVGIDHVLVVDNGSTDGTLGILEELATTSRVHVVSRPGPFHQAETTTEFAREAFLRGARWVLPIDADEFWHVPGGRLRDVLDDAADAGALEVEVVNFVQRREQESLDTRALLTMTRRVPTPVGSSGEASELVESGRISFVECRYPPKCISRASIALQIGQGNHSVTGTDGPLRKTAAIVCLHAPLRARAALAVQKVEQGRRVEEVNHYLRQAWHVRRWRRLADEGGIDAEWAANSYRDDCLDVDGARHPLAIDARLRDLVEPWIEARVSGTMKTPPAPPAIGSTPPPAAEPDSVITTEILERISGVGGWLRDEEAELLIQGTRRALTELDVPVVVEIGSFCGKSTIVLSSAARSINPSARVYAIDPHLGEVGAEGSADGIRVEPPTFERFQRNVAEAGLAEVIEPIRQRSYDVRWRSPIAFLFIDGLHDYTSVARDFFHFEPHLPDGAYVAFHDCDDNYPGVRAFVTGLAASGRYEEVDRAASLVVVRKMMAATNALGADDDVRAMALSLRVSQQEKGIAFLVAEIAARDRTIKERDEGIEWLRGVIRDKELTIAELEKGVAWLRTEVAERERTIEALRRASAPASETIPDESAAGGAARQHHGASD
jgi:glycosyltransferase involved in cell wall biosynthesis